MEKIKTNSLYGSFNDEELITPEEANNFEDEGTNTYDTNENVELENLEKEVSENGECNSDK